MVNTIKRRMNSQLAWTDRNYYAQNSIAQLLSLSRDPEFDDRHAFEGDGNSLVINHVITTRLNKRALFR